MLSTVEEVSSTDDVVVAVRGDTPRDLPSEVGFVTLNEAAARLDVTGRARLALDIAHAALQQLAAARGWDRAVLDSCRAHVLEHELGYSRASAWKAAPGRRRQARACFRLDAHDGFARVHLEIRDRDGVAEHVSPEAVGFCTSAGMARSAKTLTWAGPDTVSLVPYAGLVPNHAGGSITATSGSDGWSSAVHEFATVRTPGEGLPAHADAQVPPVSASLA